MKTKILRSPNSVQEAGFFTCSFAEGELDLLIELLKRKKIKGEAQDLCFYLLNILKWFPWRPVPLGARRPFPELADMTRWPLTAKAPCLEELYEAEREESITHLKVTAPQHMNQAEVTKAGGVRILAEDVKEDD